MRLPQARGAWVQDAGDRRQYTPVSVRHAGFAGLVGDQDWQDEMREAGDHDDSDHDGFDEDAWDETHPEPTPEEHAHFEEHGDYPDSHFERHDQAYAEHMDRKNRERERDSELDHDDPDLRSFVGNHGSNTQLWHEHGRIGKIRLDQPVYATQSHVAKEHIQKYLDDPNAMTYQRERYGHDAGAGYLGNEHPMFVTHEGRLHCTEGHHRVAAALQRGDKHIYGAHFDLDRDAAAVPDEDEG